MPELKFISYYRPSPRPHELQEWALLFIKNVFDAKLMQLSPIIYSIHEGLAITWKYLFIRATEEIEGQDTLLIKSITVP